MKEIYKLVCNKVDKNHADLYVYYKDGSNSIHYIPEQKDLVNAVLGEAVTQFGVKNYQELKDNKTLIYTTPDNFDKAKENIEFLLSKETEDVIEENNQKEETGLSVIKEETGLSVIDDISNTEAIQAEIDKILEEADLPKVNFIVATPGAFYAFAEDDMLLEYDAQILENNQAMQLELGLIILQLAKQHGISINLPNFINEQVVESKRIIQELESINIAYTYSSSEFRELLKYMNNANRIMNEAIHGDNPGEDDNPGDGDNPGQDDNPGQGDNPESNSNGYDRKKSWERVISNFQQNNPNNKKIYSEAQVKAMNAFNIAYTKAMRKYEDSAAKAIANRNKCLAKAKNQKDIDKAYNDFETAHNNAINSNENSCQKAYEKLKKAFAKAEEKIKKYEAKVNEKIMLARMSRKDQFKYKWNKRIETARNFVGKIPIIGKIINKPKKKGGILRKIAKFLLIPITTMVIGFVGLFSKDIGKDIGNFIKGLFTHNSTEESQINSSNIDNISKQNNNNTKKYKDIKDALKNAKINDNKKHAISRISGFLRKYNTEIAKANSKGNQKTKLAHTWEEVAAFYLGVNNIAQDKINDIFDSYNFDANKFLQAFKKGVQQDVQAYIVNKNEINKDCLIEGDEGKMFVTNLEKLKTQLQSLDDNSDITRESVSNQFYAKVRKAYLSKDAEMKAYKAAALPIIKAMNILTKDLQFENKLSLDERQEIDRKVYEDVGKRLKKYENKLVAHIAANGLTTDDEVSYKDLRGLAIHELKEENSYNVIAKKRDITGQKNYKIVIKKSKPTVVDNNSKREENNQQVTSKTQSKYKVKVKKSNHKNSSNSSKAVIKDWVVSEPTDGAYFNPGNDSTITFPPTDTDQFDRDHLDHDNINFDNILKPGDNSLDDGTIDDAYQDGNGNLDNSVTDTTTDSTGAVNGDTPLPDPNAPGSEQVAGNQSANEVIADQIIEDMANNPTSSTDSIKVFYRN